MSGEARSFLSFFLRLGASRVEAEDLTQETFLKLFRHAPRYEARERFEAFALRVARNAWIDRQRRLAVRPAAAAGSSADDAPFEGQARSAAGGRVDPDDAHQPFAAAAGAEETARVTAALTRLSEPHRIVFELGVLQERPYAEIAALLGVPVGTVKSRMFHAVRKLRAELDPRAAGEEALG